MMLKVLLGEEDEDTMMLKALLGEEDEDDMMLKARVGEEDEDVVMLKSLLGEEDQDADTNSCFGRAAFAMPANYGAVPAGSEVEPILHHIVPKCDVSGPTGIAACGDDFTAFVDEHGEV